MEIWKWSSWKFWEGWNAGIVGPLHSESECLIAHVADLSAEGDHQTCKDIGILEAVF